MNWPVGQLGLGLMLLVTGTQACSSSVADQPSSTKPSGENLGVIELHVRNFGDVNAGIYALYRGGRTRLGTLRTTSAMDPVRVFVLEWSTPEELQLGVNLDRGRSCTTPPVLVSSGAVIDFQVPGAQTMANPGDGAAYRYMRSDGYQEDMGMICSMVVR
jgi:hypothetical protein